MKYDNLYNRYNRSPSSNSPKLGNSKGEQSYIFEPEDYIKDQQKKLDLHCSPSLRRRRSLSRKIHGIVGRCSRSISIDDVKQVEFSRESERIRISTSTILPRTVSLESPKNESKNDEPLLSGFLLKNMNGVWQEKHFVLFPMVCTYCNSDGLNQNKIPIKMISKITDLKDNTFSLTVQMSAEITKTISLQAGNEDMCTRWITAFRTAMKEVNYSKKTKKMSLAFIASVEKKVHKKDLPHTLPTIDSSPKDDDISLETRRKADAFKNRVEKKMTSSPKDNDISLETRRKALAFKNRVEQKMQRQNNGMYGSPISKMRSSTSEIFIKEKEIPKSNTTAPIKPKQTVGLLQKKAKAPGWKTRYFVLTAGSGCLTYYKKSNLQQVKGAIDLTNCVLVAGDPTIDDSKFRIDTCGLNYVLKAQSAQDKQRWIKALKSELEYLTIKIKDGHAAGMCRTKRCLIHKNNTNNFWITKTREYRYDQDDNYVTFMDLPERAWMIVVAYWNNRTVEIVNGFKAANSKAEWTLTVGTVMDVENILPTTVFSVQTAITVISLLKVSTLTSLSLSGIQMSDAGCKFLYSYMKTNAKYLLKLNLKPNILSDDAMVYLASSLKVNQTLTSLDLQKNQLNDIGAITIMNALKVNTVLKYLDFRNNPKIGIEGAKSLADSIFESQTLKNFSGIPVWKIKNNDPDITSLDLCESKISNTEAIILSLILKKNTVLILLDTRHNPSIGSSAAQSLALSVMENKNIETFSGIPIRSIQQNDETTTTLSLGDGCADTEAYALAFLLMTNHVLLCVEFGEHKIKDSGAKAIGRSLRDNNTLEKLTINGEIILNEFRNENRELTFVSNGYKGAEAIIIGSLLTTNISITSVDIRGNSINGIEAGILATILLERESIKIVSGIPVHDLQTNISDVMVLKVCGGMQVLGPSKPKIGDVEAYILSVVMISNTMITELTLDNNKISGSGAYSLAKALTFNNRITKLQLWENKITDIAVRALGDVLKINKTLTDLDLGGNQIADAGAYSIADSLRTNSTLLYLYLSANNITDRGACAIAEGLKINKSIWIINIKYNKFGKDGASALAKVKKEHYSLQKLLF